MSIPVGYAVVANDAEGFIAITIQSRGLASVTADIVGGSGIQKTFPNEMIVAEHETAEDALAAVERAKAVEKQFRPYWQMAIEHERRVRAAMLDAVYSAARPKQ